MKTIMVRVLVAVKPPHGDEEQEAALTVAGLIATAAREIAKEEGFDVVVEG